MNLTYPLYDCIFFNFSFSIHSQRIVVNGHYIIYETEDVTHSGMYVFNYFVVSLSKFFSWSVRHFFVYLRPPFFIVFHQHPLMVRGTSSSSSNRSRSHSKHTHTHTAIKVGPPTKKADAVSMAKSKKTKQESIKKSVRKSKYFFCWLLAHLMLHLDQMETYQMRT